MLEINYRLLEVLPKKVHFCFISVIVHTVFTEEYVFLNCIHTGNEQMKLQKPFKINHNY
jgi:hypothetical protein